MEAPMPQKPFRDATIVFDLDGTLVDTAPDLTNALNDVLIRRGHAAVSAATIRSAVGMGARVMIEEALQGLGGTDDVEAMLAEFLLHYEGHIAEESRPYWGAVAALDAFQSAGATLAVCTNKREYLSRKLLGALGLEDYFAVIAGRDTFAVSKPDPGHLTKTIALAGGNRARALMVGDSEVDLRTARSANIPVVLVSFGYARGPLGSPEPDALIDHFDELPPLAGLLLGRRMKHVSS
jgi:phosphoglycolate phosphatase